MAKLQTDSLLVDDPINPNLWLLGCTLRNEYLKCEIGFIRAHMLDDIYNLYDETGEFICQVQIPLAAIRFPIDLFCILSDEKIQRA
jgi:hypothetical protein